MPKPFERRYLVSDFTMGLLDFERYDKILQAINMAFESVYAGKSEAIYSLYANLNTLYLEWSPIMLESIKTEVKNLLDELKTNMDNMAFTDKESRGIEMIKQQEFKDALDMVFKIREKLMMERQRAGFGIKTSLTQTDRQIFKRALKI